ncbi:hypothetical protein FANTH_12216 [Fusarium anthophilum]|uniref:Uncharacterized protein n=1 Tax=Fusarium anthophilum TaxID=48485 RepID=A0A8H5DSU3_9HYPO|nr:hypothetical protein FANTH_12216 [Fusarium anthophilum]
MQASKFLSFFALFVASASALAPPAVFQRELLEKRELGPRQATPPNSPSLFEGEEEEEEEETNNIKYESLNPRLFHGFNEVGQNYQGLYLHWKLPQLYRATAEVSAGAEEFKKECFTNDFLSLEKLCEAEGGARCNADASNATTGDISELGPEIDIEVDVSPFVDAEKPSEGQEDMFLGNKISVYADGAQPPNSDEDEKKSVPLSILNSSNPLFADFQPHNSNVFSMADTFSYQHDLGNGKSETRTLTEANADYFIRGWVYGAKLDVFSAKSKTNGEILKELGLELTDGDELYAIYGATWRKETAPENKAHGLANLFTQQMPGLVGYSPLDSFRAWASTREAPESFQWQNDTKLDSSLTGTPKSFSDLLYEMETFTKISPRNPDNYRAQRDRALLQAFTVSSLGYVEKLIDKGDQTNSKKPQPKVKVSFIPSHTQKLPLAGLGKWDLFAEWWKVKTSEQSMAEVDLNALRPSSSDAVRPIAEKTPSELFYQRREPTMTVARAVSAWNIRQVYPKGEDQETKAVFTAEAKATDNLEDSSYNAMEFHRPKMNAVVFTTMQELVREWVRIGSKDDQHAPKRTTKPSIVNPPYESRTL